MDKTVYIALTIFFSISLLAGTGASFAANDNSYSIPLINEDLYVQSDGTLHVKEVIHYSFIGTFHGIYRDIPLTGSQQITDVKVTSTGAYSNYTIINDGTTKRIQVFLYSNPQKTIPITNRNVDVTIQYNFLNGINVYNDIGELQYKLVGQSWAVAVGKVIANIHVNSSQGVRYWLNPPYYATNSSWNNNVLQITSTSIPSGQYFEVRMVIPKNQFLASPINANRINQNGLSSIIAIQNDYQNSLNFKTWLYHILSVPMLLALFIPLIIYLRYGREPKIDYNAEYERDIPTNDPPAIVNAICGSGLSKKIGKPDMDGFKATIMDLINRKYLIIEKEHSDMEGYGLREPMFLKVNANQDSSTLEEFELDVMNFLKRFEENGLISMDRISDDLSDPQIADSFRNTYNSWTNDIKSKFLDDNELKKFFNRKGDSLLKIFGGVSLVVAAVIFIFTLNDSLPAARVALLVSILLGVVAIISIILPEKIAGQWTTYGEEYDAKWHNFKRYIKDFSLMKEYPPESIAIWNKYLVYATALGAADAVKKAMELNVPGEQLEASEIYMFYYFGGDMLLNSAFNIGINPASGALDTIDTIGNIGGGFGGGGGGAF
ncbi:DUF2207 domain-containing protein [Methanobacterium sp.]|uniref:DUF2207 domain-containing protein n=1 Tax=Methanobacterium sp. TaxID=2164 RepID=UPI003C7146C3